VKGLLLEVVAAAAAAVVAAPNGNGLPLVGAGPALAVDADQFPKRDLPAGCAAGCVAAVEPVVAVHAGALVMPGNPDGVTVVPLVDPNTEEALLKEPVAAGGAVV